MIELPLKKVKASRVNPKSMIIFSQPKVGKTTIVSELEDCLIIDIEDGSEFVDAVKINVLGLAKREELDPLSALKSVIDKIREENEKKGDFVYRFIALDTVTALEEIVLPLANQMYRNTSLGRNWQGDDVTTLPKGAGYGYTRRALSKVLNEIKSLCDTLIILGHVKDKLVDKNGKEMTERGLDLTGKSSSILCSQVDAIGYLYRKDNKTIINFKPSESLICGARNEHMKDLEITVAVSDDQGNLKIDWSQIFKK